ncbi:unnamed protein product [Closterium sp. NIES-54]
MQGLDPLPMGVSSLKKEKENLERVREQVERVLMALLLSIALRWPRPVLVPGGFDEDGSRTPLEGLGWVGGGRFWSHGFFGGGRGAEEDFWDGGEVWEEVWSWCGAAMIAWPAYVNGGSETCRGKHGGKASEVLNPETVYDLCRRTAKVRYHGDMEEQSGSASGYSSGSGSGSSGSSSSSSRCQRGNRIMK